MSKAKDFALGMLILLSGIADSLAENYQVLRLPISELLPQNTPADLHIDQKGFLWLSMGRMVYRYDGYRLSRIYVGKEDPNPGTITKKRKFFTSDSSGSTWLIDGSGQLRRYEPNSRTFVRKHHLISEVEREPRIHSLAHDGRGTLWMLLDGGNIALLDTLTAEPSGLVESSNYLSGEDYLVGIDFNVNGAAWILSREGVLLECREGSDSCDQIDLTLLIDVTDTAYFKQVIATADDKLIVSTESHGIYELNLTSLSTEPLRPQTSDGQDYDQFEQIWGISVSPAGDIWVATLAGLFGPTSKARLAPYHSANSKEQRLIVTQFEDLDGDRFLALSPGEILLIRKTLFESFGNSDELTSPITTAFAQSVDGVVYIGSIHGLSTFKPSVNQASPLYAKFPETDLIDNRVMALFSDKDGMWLGGYDGGLRHLNYSSGNIKKLAPRTEDLSAITQIIGLPDDLLLVSTPEHGLFIIEKSGQILAEHPPHFGVTSSQGSFVMSMILSSRGSILIGTESGVYELKIGPFSDASDRLQPGHYLEGEEVYDVFETSDGSIWVGTYQNGIYRSTVSNAGIASEFVKIETSPSLPDETINAIEEDDMGMLWLSTNKGLVRLNPKTNSISVYNESDGLVDDEFNVGASLRDSEGFIYFGSHKGFSRFNPRRFVKRRVPPPLLLTEIMIHRKPVHYDPAYLQIPELVLDHNDHSLDIEFSTMDIINPGRSRYKYRLDNFDSDWIDIGTRNSATFTNLPAGQYVLRVIGADSKGVWNYDGVALPVRVLPAPWLTWWAFTLYALLMFALIVMMKRVYDIYLEKVAAIREAEDMKITATLAMDDLQDQLEVENRLVDNLRKHAKSAFDMVDEFLTLELEELYGDEIEEPLGRARQRLQSLQALEASVYFHGDLLKVNFRDAIDRCYSEVIKVHPHPEAELVLANDCSEELLPIDTGAPLLLLAHELIMNSVLHAFPGFRGVECIEVSFKPEAGAWVFEVSDSGCGLPAAIDPVCPTSLGMELVMRIVARLGAKVEVSRENGTLFKVTLPQEFG